MGKVHYDYSGRVVLVTGGGSGIGAAMVQGFSQAGARLAVADINLAAAEASVAAIREAGGDAEAFHVDVGDELSVKAMMDAVMDRMGRLDVAANNAGIEADVVPITELSGENFRRVSDVNLASVFYCMKAQIPVMKRNGGGAIINTASVSGLVGGFNLAAYTATKHGVVGMTKAAAMENAASGVRINALCPGLVDTPFIAKMPPAFRERLLFGVPIGRPAQAEEIAAAALWICSDAASYVTGHAMVVDGATSVGAASTRFDDLMG